MRRSSFWRFALIVLIVLAAAACGGTPIPTPAPPTATPTSAPPTATPTPAPPTATPTPVAPAVTPTVPMTTRPTSGATAGNASAADRELVAAAFNNLSRAVSFGMKVSVVGESTALPFSGDIVMEISQVPTRSVDIKISDQLEMIIIGQDVYVKAGAATWQQTPMDPSQLKGLQESLNFAQSVKVEDLAAVEINKLGSEKVDSVDSDVFNVTTSVSGKPRVTTVWIARADKTLLKQELKDDSGTIRVTFYGWNKITVQPPKL